jgi:hypothetical protein
MPGNLQLFRGGTEAGSEAVGAGVYAAGLFTVKELNHGPVLLGAILETARPQAEIAARVSSSRPEHDAKRLKDTKDFHA